MNARSILLTSALFAMAADAVAGEWYRFRNEEGHMVLSHTVPPALVDNGYTVVSDDGTVLRVVPSKAEQTRQRAAEERQRATEKAENERKRDDEALLKLYASSADVSAARDRKLRSIEVDISRVRADLESLRHKKTNLEQQGAERERSGLGPSEEILKNLEIIDAQIEERERNIDARRLEQQQIRESFNRDMERVRLLLGEPVPEAQAGAVKTPAAIAGH